MSDREQRLEQLRRKYGAKGIDNAARLNAHDFPELMEWRDELDPHFAKLWLDFTYGGLLTRGVLDDRSPAWVERGLHARRVTDAKSGIDEHARVEHAAGIDLALRAA